MTESYDHARVLVRFFEPSHILGDDFPIDPVLGRNSQEIRVKLYDEFEILGVARP
jgi:hypothetical protein